MEDNGNIAWAAGLFEAEGCASGGVKRPRFAVWLTEEVTLRRFADVVDGGVTGPYQVARFGRRGRDEWAWQVSGFEKCLPIYLAFRPYLRNRRRARAEEVLVGTPLYEEWADEFPDDERAEAWAAGLYEGDGSIVRCTHSPMLEVSSIDRDVLERMQRILGGKLRGPYDTRSRLGTRPFWVWAEYGVDPCSDIISRLWPWLSERRRERAADVLTDRRYLRKSRSRPPTPRNIR